MKRIHESSSHQWCARCGEQECMGCIKRRMPVFNNGDTLIIGHDEHKIAARVCERIDYGVYRIRIINKNKPVVHFLRTLNGTWEWLLCHETGERPKELYYRNLFKCLKQRVEILRIKSEK